MIITIVTGGSGSVNIQKGFNDINPYLKLNLIINGYDDGKSTGILRNLFPESLGISDFRKNQILEYKLINGNNDLYKLLNHRFTNANPYTYIIDLINKTNFNNNEELKEFFLDNSNYFFNTQQSKNIIYEDFSFMNIIYCSLLNKNNNNMEIVCNIIKDKLSLKNDIFLNSNINLTLKGITKNNKILLDEASIVDFDFKDDKIIDIFFDKEMSVLNKNTEELLLKSDIIIFSCGTQFSSLIPTYKTLLFKETIEKSKALKYLILNCNYDKDIINYTGNELLDKINEYLPLKNVKIIISDNMNKNLFPNKNKYNYINIQKLINNDKHDGYILCKYILKDFFEYYFNNNYIFDYDYTLFDKKYENISIENIKLLEKIKNRLIVTNNCISNLMPINDTIIYSNISNISNINSNIEIIDNKYLLNEMDIKNIYEIIDKININKLFDIINRKNISISVKPIYDRDTYLNKLNMDLLKTDYEAIKTGNTTIEVIKKGLSKRKLFIKKNFLNYNYTYITDKNDIDYDYKTDNIKYLEVKDIITTNLFLNSIIMNQKYDFCIIVGGINKRMNIDYPKCLIKIEDEIVLMKMINKIMPYCNKIYICGNNYYKKQFLEFEKTLEKYDNIKFLYFNSIDNKQDYPRGNGETIYQLLKNYTLTDKIFILWGDVLLSNEKIFEELYNLQYNSDFLIPVIYEENPYAYLIINEKNNVERIEYKKNKPISYGYHDQCIFLCDTKKIINNIDFLISKQNNYDEINFLDIIIYLDNVKYFITNYVVKSYNTPNEL